MKLLSKLKAKRSYDYSPAHRLLEVCAIFSFFAFLSVIGLRAVAGFVTVSLYQALWIGSLSAILGYIAADFVSGFVHWMGDTFGDIDMPVLGAAFIKPFRDHHVDPEDITRHDFIEVNGNNSLVLLIIFVPAFFLFKEASNLWHLFMLSFTVFFAFGIFMTNQFHKWAHLPERPAWIVRLQSLSLILAPDNHNIHHTSPFDTYYCITNGWLNPLLHRLRFFQLSEKLVRWVLRIPKQTT
ncbi:MAG: kua-ubiquitin conjugating enzyme hybrid localization domain protein [Bradymonadaceae bacterium]|nr:kua-ubiquitin conjugating enzyme hybrid localization domain protein [Lujinxingiaceae bacterium]